MLNTVSPYSWAVRVCAVLVSLMSILNAVLIYGFGLVPLTGIAPWEAVWLAALHILNTLLSLGVAFMGAEAGLAGGPADHSARQRLAALTGWLPIAGVLVVSFTLISPGLGQALGTPILWTPRQVVGALIVLGWALFGWAAVQRWLRQGSPIALSALTRIMEGLALVALAMDIVQVVSMGLGDVVQVGAALGEALNALTQALAVIVCVEAVSGPNPERLNGWLGSGVRWLTVLAWSCLAVQLGAQVLAIIGRFELSALALLGPLTVAASVSLSFSERLLLAATLWAREQRLLGGSNGRA